MPADAGLPVRLHDLRSGCLHAVQRLCFVTNQNFEKFCCWGRMQAGWRCAGCAAFLAAVQQALLRNTCHRQQEARLPDADKCGPHSCAPIFNGAATALSIGLVRGGSRVVGRWGCRG